MGRSGTIEIRVTRTHTIPSVNKCDGCGEHKDDVYCKLFKKVLHLDGRYKHRVPVPECIEARKAARRRRKK